MNATPRTQVSMAGFYDWSSDDVDDVPMATIYRKLAVHQKNKCNKSNKPWCADGVHLNPGRMFVRDKADLTKGEREIIAGICKNRGDLNISKHGIVAQVKSHKDAWLTGKHIVRKQLEPIDQEKCSIKVPEHLFSKADSPKNSPRMFCYMCDQCRDTCLHSKLDKENRLSSKDEKNGRMAPPSSPSNSPKPMRKASTKQTKSNLTEGAVFVEAGKTFYDSDEGSKKKKVFVDVFLPKFPTQTLNEEHTSASILLESNNSDTNVGRERKIVKKNRKVSAISEDVTDKLDASDSSDEKDVKNLRSEKHSKSKRRGNSSDGE